MDILETGSVLKQIGYEYKVSFKYTQRDEISFFIHVLIIYFLYINQLLHIKMQISYCKNLLCSY